MFVDCHHHLWDLAVVNYPWLMARGERRFFGDPTPIQRDYLVEDFRGDWSGIPIDASVHIQVGAAPGQEVAETRWLDERAQQTGLPTAIVAYGDLASPNFESVLDRHLEASSRLRGVRQIVSRHPDEDTSGEGLGMLDNVAFHQGLALLAERSLSFDLQLTPDYLERAAEVFGGIPSCKVALCHAGSPWKRDRQSLNEWRLGLRAFATVPGAVCKLSGLSMLDPDWNLQTLKPVIAIVLEEFGPDRVMWGSNFPVDKLYSDYRDLFEAIRKIVPENDHAAVFGENAARFYRLVS